MWSFGERSERIRGPLNAEVGSGWVFLDRHPIFVRIFACELNFQFAVAWFSGASGLPTNCGACFSCLQVTAIFVCFTCLCVIWVSGFCVFSRSHRVLLLGHVLGSLFFMGMFTERC